MHKTLITTALLIAPAIAGAQSFSPPEGCTGKLTVQHKGCALVNVWTCEGDAAGDQWIGLFGQSGPFSVQRVDDEFQWMETFKPSGTETLIEPAPDAASFTELVENGLDTYEFTIDIANGAGDETTVGFDTLTGLEVEIDGEPLLQTEFQGVTLDGDGNQLNEGAGRQYISVKHRLFFFAESWDPATPDDITDMSPVEFIYPGEPGFFAAKPKFECNVIESSYRP